MKSTPTICFIIAASSVGLVAPAHAVTIVEGSGVLPTSRVRDPNGDAYLAAAGITNGSTYSFRLAVADLGEPSSGIAKFQSTDFSFRFNGAEVISSKLAGSEAFVALSNRSGDRFDVSLVRIGDFAPAIVGEEAISFNLVLNLVDGTFDGRGALTAVEQIAAVTFGIAQFGFGSSDSPGGFAVAEDIAFGGSPPQSTLEISVAAIPEPTTWLMQIVGIGIVGGVLRALKRRKFNRQLEVSRLIAS